MISALKRTDRSLPILTAGILLAGIIAVINFFVLGVSAQPEIAEWIYAAFLTIIFALMVYTGQTSLYRRIFFISFALLFFPSFMSNLIETRGHIALSEADIANTETPFCHIVIPFSIIPAVFTKTVIFPAEMTNGYASVYSMLIIWLAASLTIGRGWCSWLCFYGGWDEAFSRTPGKRKINLDNPSPELKYFNFSMLLFLVLVSAVTLSSIYCEWFCPFKLVTEFGEITDIISYLATIIFIVLFFGLVVAMPILTKKRFQCAVFCPFGAFQSLVDKISLYSIRIDKEKCTGCMACVKACPTLSLDSKLIKSEREEPLITCTKCGECIPACSKGAISYSFKQKRAEKAGKYIADKLTSLKTESSEDSPKAEKRIKKALHYLLKSIARLLSPDALLPFTAFTFGTILSYGFAADTINMILELFKGAVQ